MPKNPSELGTRLREALDHLVDAARLVARPGWIWIAGFLYPSVEGNLDIVDLDGGLNEAAESVTLGLGQLSPWDDLGNFQVNDDAVLGGLLAVATLGTALALVLPLLLAVNRISAGLAACSTPEAWARSGDPTQPPGLRTAWEAGKGLSWSALGISILLGMMRVIALLVIGIPALQLRDFLSQSSDGLELLLGIVYLPLAGILLVYFLVLAALHQLALHSLVQNRRGMTSALQHAWRLFRVDPMISLSCMIVEGSCVLLFSLVALTIGLISAVLCFLIPVAMIVVLGLNAFQGVLRAAFWASVYRHMGGATSEDTLGGIGATPSQSGVTPPAQSGFFKRV